ncbi:hypothetical protein [Paraburkholderia phymatum]|uniref:hypothetical protein n=1 Tax=Paraburkholderia phymatum TaxID=148447 RepID=UPI0012FDD7A7|nr:hypothetical protein [Paraburkholderia phymatum]
MSAPTRVASVTDDADTVDRRVAVTDAAMYEAKREKKRIGVASATHRMAGRRSSVCPGARIAHGSVDGNFGSRYADG